MKIRSISHVGLTVSNFEKAVKWYSTMFGFKLISEQTLSTKEVEELYPLYKLHNTSIRFGFLRVPKGGVLEIFEFNNPSPSSHVEWNKPGYTHFTLDVKNIPKWYKNLKSKGVFFFMEPQKTEGTDWIFLKDPDGNLIELIDLKINYPIIRILGGLLGNIMAKGKFKKYYMEE
ncbi:VOC family protein [Oceanirhabdus sp. W0125-5]|uniref:VOC family protein n=1 Tax=Oceanirhabdus sp. W0125-5 TaxID=2999116 RepID=UPI0022F2FEA1|nr:VOC family protein [Oceanirhabdus sp. W0125-5]WBW94872.1 VOC family protein [Oceanirhabdus sp. W0125-5]